MDVLYWCSEHEDGGASLAALECDIALSVPARTSALQSESALDFLEKCIAVNVEHVKTISGVFRYNVTKDDALLPLGSMYTIRCYGTGYIV
jgi:predicted alternative tryptophan synthase beta-subunit